MKQFDRRINKLDKDLRAAGVSFLCFFAKETEDDNNRVDTYSMAGGEMDSIVTAMVSCHDVDQSEDLAYLLEFSAKEVRKRNKP